MRSLQGYLLIASPHLRDPNFLRTVVLMVQHNDQGALGVILNRPTNTTMREAWDQVSDTPCEREETLYHGGPCEGPLMAVHSHLGASQIEVSPGIYFSTDRDDVATLVQQNDDPAKFFVGCSGWGPGQIERETKTGSWLTIPATCEQVFRDNEDQWAHLTNQIARSTGLVALNPKIIPEDPSLN